MSGCLPCDLEAAPDAAVVYRDATWSCEVAEGYDVPGWYILRLRRHAEGWGALTPDEAAGFGTVSQRVATAIQAATGATGAYFMSFGENYPHFHFLVLARPADLAPELRGAGILAMRADNMDMEASLDVAASVRDALARADRT
jgi:diadenosine tetraphosphate (Ap4A) HIT family hydrolase